MALSDTLSRYDGYRFPPFADIKYSHTNAAHPVFCAWLLTFYFSIIFFYFWHQEDENAGNTPSHSHHTEKTVSYKKAYRLMRLLFRYYFFFLSF